MLRLLDPNKAIRRLKARNVIFEGHLSQVKEEHSSSRAQGAEVSRLMAENKDPRKQAENLKQQLINEQSSANAQVDVLLKSLALHSFFPCPLNSPLYQCPVYQYLS